MTIIAPVGYHTVKEPCIFNVTQDTGEVADISINSYIKQMGGTNFVVNISDYYKEAFNFSPMLEINNEVEGIDIARVVPGNITIEDKTSDSVMLLYATQMPEDAKFLNNIKKQNILSTDIIELSALASNAFTIILSTDMQGTAVIKTFSTSREYTVIAFAPPTGVKRFYAHLNVSGTIVDTIEYNIIEHCCGVRLAWINRFGTLEYYRFAHNQEKTLTIDKTKIYGKNGYVVTSVEAEEKTTVSTKKITTATVEALSDIIMSDKVFRIFDDNTFTEISIDTNTTKIYNINDIQNIQITFRGKERKI